MTKDLTAGLPIKRILLFALPLLFGILFQQFYNIVDTVIVGQFLGVKALAGVGSTGSVNFMVLGFCNGLCSGFSIPVAKAFGARHDVVMRKDVANSIWLSAAFSLIITAFVCVFCRQILVAMKTPDDIFSYAYSYIFIIFAGIPFMVVYNLEAGILRALGDSRTPVVFLVLSSVLNIAADLLLICVFKMNVEGAAIATVFSQGVSGVLCFIHIKKRFTILKMNPGEMKPDRSCMTELCFSGIPMGLQYSVTAIGSLIIQTSMNGLGSNVVAGVTAAMKIHAFITSPLEALGSTMAPFTGQNIGARKIDRIEKGTLAASVCGFAVSGVILLIVLLFSRQLVGIFLDEADEEVLFYASRYLISTASFYCLLTLVLVVRFSIQGMGYSVVAILAGVMEMIARSIVGLFFAPRYGFAVLCFAHPLAWLLADLFLIPTFFICKKRVSRELLGDK